MDQFDYELFSGHRDCLEQKEEEEDAPIKKKRIKGELND